MRKLIAALLVLVGCATSVWAIPTALIQIPTADVSAPAAGFVDVSMLPTTSLDLNCESVFIETNFGLPGGIELGFDSPLNSLRQGAFFLKQAWPELSEEYGIAVGINGIGGGSLARTCHRGATSCYRAPCCVIGCHVVEYAPA